MSGYAWVTLATNDAYSLGALVLAHSLRRVGTSHELAVLVTPGVTETMRDKLSAVFSVVMEVNVLDSKDEANLALLARPELGITFTKLHCWRLTQYEKCVFLDADTLVVRNCDELFEREELSAAPDVGWPDCFNSGVFVYRPSQQTFASITAFAAAKGSFDGGDQGLLNMYFSDWAHKDISKHLPFIYNMCSTAVYSYLPAFKQFGDDVRIIHFIGITKPWLQYFDTLTGIVQPPVDSVHLQPLLQLWWNIFCEKVHPQLSPVMATSTLAPIWHKFSPILFESFIPKSPIYAEIQDKTQSDIYLDQADFSEFKDPWENYCIQNNKIEQYYSTIDSSSPLSVSNDEHFCLNSVQHISEPCPEHNREVYHNPEYNEYNNSLSHTQHYHNQEQCNEFINENEQHSFCYPKDISKVQSDDWQHQHSIEKCIPGHITPSYYSSEPQHQSTDYRYIPPSLFENSNKSLSKRINNQHNRLYVDHQCNHHHMHNNINTKQTIHHEQKNQNFYCNEQIDFEFTKRESLNIKPDHDQATKNSVICQNDISTEENVEQNENINITDKQTVTLISTTPYPVSKPCTDFHNVASQSDSHIMEDINNSNAGLAGALAQMTLGEPRSAEQIALEEHMRKQSWEQGHIDYMGRDSFDNIWKKICETLALAPPRLPSPPKETEKLAETTTNKTVESVKSTEAIEQIESTDEVDAKAAEATSIRTEEQSLVNIVPITDSKSMIPKLTEKDEQIISTISSVSKNGEELSVSEETTVNSLKKSDTTSENKGFDTLVDPSSTKHSMQVSHEKVMDSNMLLKQDPLSTTPSTVPSNTVETYQIKEQKLISTTENLASNMKNVLNIETAVNTQKIKQSDIKNEKYAKALSTAPEVLMVNPVPIQVAESVLQLEPKDSMPTSQIKTQEILPSMITPDHITETKYRTHVNGSSSLTNLIPIKDIDAATKLNELPTKSQELQIFPQTEQTQCTTTEMQSTSTLTLTSSISESTGLLETSPDKSLYSTTESIQEMGGIESCQKEVIQSIESPSECETPKTTPLQETPVRPSRTKELNIPSTSALKITMQDSKDPEKVTKKVIKKSLEKSTSEKGPIETTEGDIVEKKVVKKVVKKVTKKTKLKSEEVLDDGTENSSSSKQKKTVKVKKSTKAAQTPSTDIATPETSSPSTSVNPIPPKRKAKPITKKSDIEQ